MRSTLLFALFALSGSITPLTACFSEASNCTDGAAGCPCLNLDCESGLMCKNGICIAIDSTGSGTATSTVESGSTTLTSDSASSDTTSSGTPSTVCGNAILEDGEECDGVPGCTNCELDNWDCNPLNNAPCMAGWKCSYDGETTGTPAFTCKAIVEPPPGKLHEENCFNFRPLDEWCDVGLACATLQGANACMAVASNCCVEYCDLRDTSFKCADTRDSCVPFWIGAVPAGLTNLGICAIPSAPLR